MSLPETWTPEPIQGWRVWVWPRVSHAGRPAALHSTYTHDVWHREMPPATCHPAKCSNIDPHRSPSEGAMCGYYSMKLDLLAQPERWHEPLWAADGVLCLGTIGLTESWGEVIEYEHGYRSQRIRIEALIDISLAFIEEHSRPFVAPFEDEDFARAMTMRDHEAYRSRLYQAAEKYRVPIVSIEDAHAGR